MYGCWISKNKILVKLFLFPLDIIADVYSLREVLFTPLTLLYLFYVTICAG